MISIYRIRDWNEIYETSRTRELKRPHWIAIPIKLSGDGYCLIMDEEDGSSIFGTWIAIVEVAAMCDPRGTMVRSTGEPHDSRSISRITRIPEKIIKRTLDFTLLKCKWLEIIDETGKVAPSCGIVAPSCGNPALQYSTDSTVQTRHNNIAKAEEVYKEYPRKAGHKKAIDSIIVALKKTTHENLLMVVKQYAISVQGKEMKYIPHPTTWFNQERWKDPIGGSCVAVLPEQDYFEKAKLTSVDGMIVDATAYVTSQTQAVHAKEKLYELFMKIKSAVTENEKLSLRFGQTDGIYYAIAYYWKHPEILEPKGDALNASDNQEISGVGPFGTSG